MSKARVDETPIDEPVNDELAKADEAPATFEPEKASDGSLASSGLTDAVNAVKLSGAAGVVDESPAPVMAEGNDQTPRAPQTPEERIASSGFVSGSVVGRLDDGSVKAFDTETEAVESGAAIVDRAAPSISPILASEPAIIKTSGT